MRTLERYKKVSSLFLKSGSSLGDILSFEPQKATKLH